MVGHGGSSAGSYLADPTSPIPYHCAVIILFKSASVQQLSWLALKELITCISIVSSATTCRVCCRLQEYFSHCGPIGRPQRTVVKLFLYTISYSFTVTILIHCVTVYTLCHCSYSHGGVSNGYLVEQKKLHLNGMFLQCSIWVWTLWKCLKCLLNCRIDPVVGLIIHG